MPVPHDVIRFGTFQLDAAACRLLKNGRVVRLKPQAFKLLQMLASRPGQVVTREEIRTLLWGTGTFVDFDQGMNTVVRQIRDALGEEAERPVFVETVPKRGYRFIAPVEGMATPAPTDGPPGEMNLQKALWLNIAELRLAEVRRRKLQRRVLATALGGGVLMGLLAYLISG